MWQVISPGGHELAWLLFSELSPLVVGQEFTFTEISQTAFHQLLHNNP